MSKPGTERLDILPSNLSRMEKLAAVGQLSSSVAHEMRNLLGMIRTAAFNIDRSLSSSDATILKNLEIINRSVGRAREFIDHLLDLSRCPRGSIEVIDVVELVESLLQLFSKELEWRRIQLERKYEELPALHLERNALQECVVNLILNAMQSMENGGVITVAIKPWQQGVQITISDTGCGIPPQQLDRIFEQFFTTKKDGQGTGLGLTIARSLARDLGGDIQVCSQVGKGSHFTISLPRSDRAS